MTERPESRSRLEALIDSSEDTMRYYFVCKGCLEQMQFPGIARSVSAWIPRKRLMKKMMDIGDGG